MKNIVSLALLSLFVCSAALAERARPAMSNKMMAAPRYTASVNQLNGTGGVTNVVQPTKPSDVEPVAKPEIDMREAERKACLSNNIGIGNTFVWASRNSDTSNYANMVEDTVHPENNVCFVRIELKSDDTSRVSVSDVPAKYFMWGENVECGSWANANEIEKRILDAKKGARIGGVVASTVGSAGVGVGAMELFGNRLLDKAGVNSVMGQKSESLSDEDLYISQLHVLEKNNRSQYEKITEALKIIKASGGTLTSEQEALIKEFNIQ